MSNSKPKPKEPFGSKTPWAEPRSNPAQHTDLTALDDTDIFFFFTTPPTSTRNHPVPPSPVLSWYDPRNPSPYYTEKHAAFRDKIRGFVDADVIPNVSEWEKDNDTIPMAAYRKAGDVGLLAAVAGWPEIPGVPERPPGFDLFFSVIAQDEMCRCASGGVVWGLLGALAIGLPPIVHFGSKALKQRVAVPCIRGEKRISLCVSEATAGSDVGSLKTEATLEGETYTIVGTKKWITGGLFADFFTVACRTGGKGMQGVSLILVERDNPGVSVRAMDCMGVKGSGTAFVEFDNVKVAHAQARMHRTPIHTHPYPLGPEVELHRQRRGSDAELRQ